MGYSNYNYEHMFEASLFVDLGKRFCIAQINEISERIMGLMIKEEQDQGKKIAY